MAIDRQFEGPLNNPDLSDEENRQFDRLTDGAGIPQGQALRLVSGGAKLARRASTGDQATPPPNQAAKPANKTTIRPSTTGPTTALERLVADTPPQAHEAAMRRVHEGARVELTDEQRVFGAEQARRLAERYGKTGTEA